MAFSPSEFIELANALCQSPQAATSESTNRTVVSRSYYGAFLIAREHSGKAQKGPAIHQEVIDHFLNSNIMRSVGNRLSDLRRMRNEADYDLKKKTSAHDAKRSLRLARDIASELTANNPGKP